MCQVLNWGLETWHWRNESSQSMEGVEWAKHARTAEVQGLLRKQWGPGLWNSPSHPRLVTPCTEVDEYNNQLSHINRESWSMRTLPWAYGHGRLGGGQPASALSLSRLSFAWIRRWANRSGPIGWLWKHDLHLGAYLKFHCIWALAICCKSVFGKQTVHYLAWRMRRRVVYNRETMCWL